MVHSRRSLIERIPSLFSALAVTYFGLVILVLSLFDKEFNPITVAASDYGVGHFALEMNLGFFIAGLGFAVFAVNYSKQELRRRSRAGPILLFVAGAILVMDSIFTTNLPGGPPSLHGTIHGFGGLIFFITAPVGLLLISIKESRAQFLISLVSFIIGFVILGMPVDAGGLAERILLLVIFSSVVLRSLRMFNRASRKKPEEKGAYANTIDSAGPL